MRLTRLDQRLRRRARARALQAVYAWDLSPDGALLTVSDRLWSDLALGAPERAIAAPLVAEIAGEQPAIDRAPVRGHHELAPRATGRRSSDRCSASASPSSGLARHRPAWCIQEDVRLAERFGSPSGARGS